MAHVGPYNMTTKESRTQTTTAIVFGRDHLTRGSGGGVDDVSSASASASSDHDDARREDGDRDGDDHAWECPYWNGEHLDSWTGAAAGAITADDGDGSPVEVPYLDLLRAAQASSSALTELWRTRRCSTNGVLAEKEIGQTTPPSKEGAVEHSSVGGGIDSSSNRDVPTIAIAIPEGPLLPLAILAVHVMQCYGRLPRQDTNEALATSSTEEVSGTGAKDDGTAVRTTNSKCGAILVPLDPTEGGGRLRHVLRDCKPDFILTVPGRDAHRIRSIVAELNGLQSEGARDAGLTEVEAEVERDSNGGVDMMEMEVVDFPGLVRRSVLGASGIADEGRSHPFTQSVADDRCLNAISHIVYTSGTTGLPKGCTSSLASLRRYIRNKNDAHRITDESTVFLASSLSFDPCFSDVLATFSAGATLAIAPRSVALSGSLGVTLRRLRVTHVLCTPTLWRMIHAEPDDLPDLEVVALGGEPIPRGIVRTWARRRVSRGVSEGEDDDVHRPDGAADVTDAHGRHRHRRPRRRLLATYGVTEACVYQTCGEVFFVPEVDDGVSGDVGSGQDVGTPLPGIRVDVCREGTQLNDDESGSGPGGVDLATPPPRGSGGAGEGMESTSLVVGEVVISGGQLDRWSGYLNLPELTARKFSRLDPGTDESYASTGESPPRMVGPLCSYRTGDRGYIDPMTGHLHILGRIDGEDGMVKFNGIRVELGEIEAAVQDDFGCRQPEESLGKVPLRLPPVVLNCIVSVEKTTNSDAEGGESKKLIAYCVLSDSCLEEVGAADSTALSPSSSEEVPPPSGVVCPPGPLVTLLRARCKERVPRGCTPSTFVIIDRMPVSPTGKCDRRLLPPLASCVPSSAVSSNGVGPSSTQSQPLWEYGRSGRHVAEELVECLNLQPCQRSHVTTTTSLAILGGDSLAATRLVRALYASHHGLQNSRLLGGSYGTIEGPFAVSHLVRATNLGEYVDWLDVNGAFLECGENGHEQIVEGQTPPGDDAVRKPGTLDGGEGGDDSVLYNALLEATLLGQTGIAISILALGLDPNFGAHGGRLGKVSNRNERRKTFVSNPLHYACARGDNVLVRHLVNKGCRCNSPDASGSFPIHLACSSHDTGSSHGNVDEHPLSSSGARLEADHVDECAGGGEATEDLRRRECVRILIDEGKVALTAKDGNNQTVLHCAARAGHCELLKFLMERWREAGNAKVIRIYKKDARGRFDWRDRWFRTPVHWAVLNGNVDALRILLENGCTALPEKPKFRGSNRRTSVAIETPMDICERLFGTSDGKGLEIFNLLSNAP